MTETRTTIDQDFLNRLNVHLESENYVRVTTYLNTTEENQIETPLTGIKCISDSEDYTYCTRPHDEYLPYISGATAGLLAAAISTRYLYSTFNNPESPSLIEKSGLTLLGVVFTSSISILTRTFHEWTFIEQSPDAKELMSALPCKEVQDVINSQLQELPFTSTHSDDSLLETSTIQVTGEYESCLNNTISNEA